MAALFFSLEGCACVITLIMLDRCVPLSLDSDAWFDRLGLVLLLILIPCSMAGILVSAWNLVMGKRMGLHLFTLVLSLLLLGIWVCL